MLEALQPLAAKAPVNSPFLQDALAGLSRPQKALSPKYFYDNAGSRFFDEICGLEEYYPYRSELSLLPSVARDIAAKLRGDIQVIEFGAGALKKIQPLLHHIKSIRAFTPIDIAGEFLQACCKDLSAHFPSLSVEPVIADFCEPVTIPAHESWLKLGFFPGSTIGNFSPEEARQFLRNAGLTLGECSYLLVGVDIKKSPSVLHRAYNDRKNITARFNRNILVRMNRELGSNFDVQGFEHYAFYNTHKGCVEMHLVSIRSQDVDLAGHRFSFRRGESIHTENSYKYNEDEFRRLARDAGWNADRSWISDNGYFSLHLLKRFE